jgi:hypothetical protein
MTSKQRLRDYAELMRLREEDDDEEEEEESAEDDIQNETIFPEKPNEPIVAPEDQPLTDEKKEPIADGEIPQSSDGIAVGSFDALDPTGNVDIVFKQGNLNQLSSIPQAITQKVTLVTNTLIPLVEKALIELLGASSMYERTSATTSTSLENNTAQISGTLVYTVTMWIGLEVEYDAIAHDSQYVMNTLAVLQEVKITKCEIDVTEGTLTVSFTL